jgi:hypothetical protein
MADDAIPPTGPTESRHETGSEKKPGDGCPADPAKPFTTVLADPGGEPKLSAKAVALIAIIEALGIVLWQIADGFHGFAGVFFHWLSIACLCAGPIPAILRVIPKKRRFLFWVINAIIWLFLGVLAWAIWMPKFQPIPRLVLELNTSHSPTDFLALTNDFLYSRNTNGFDFGNTNGYVAVPANIGESNIALNFFVVNDSSVPVDTVEILAALPNDAVFLKDIRWGIDIIPPTTAWATNINPPASLGAEPFQQLDFTFRETLLPDASVALPVIIFNTRPVNNTAWGSRIPVSFRVRAKDVPQFSLGLWLLFPSGGTNTISIRPKIIPPTGAEYGTNGTATLRYP